MARDLGERDRRHWAGAAGEIETEFLYAVALNARRGIEKHWQLKSGDTLSTFSLDRNDFGLMLVFVLAKMAEVGRWTDVYKLATGNTVSVIAIRMVGGWLKEVPENV